MARVLIADDDEDLRAMLKLVIENAGYEVEAVGDGEAAIRAQEERPADLLIADLFMPVRDGLETLEYFRSRYPGMRMIAISGGGYTGQKTDHLAVAEHAGADAVFRKPFDVGKLIERVRSLIST